MDAMVRSLRKVVSKDLLQISLTLIFLLAFLIIPSAHPVTAMDEDVILLDSDEGGPMMGEFVEESFVDIPVEDQDSIVIPDDNVGFYKPSQMRWYLKNNTTSGWNGITSFGFGGPSEMIPVAGDWDGDGDDTVGFYIPDQMRWYLKSNTTSGWGGVTSFSFGGPAEMIPVAGDWDGDGDDTVGFYIPDQMRWYLKNNTTSGWGGVTSFSFGGPAEMIPVAGDWDGDGDDTVGFYIPGQMRWYLKNNTTSGWNGITSFGFGGPAEMIPVAGDWDGDGDDTVGFYVPGQYRWYLKNNTTSGWNGITSFSFGGAAEMIPVAGNWPQTLEPCYTLTRSYVGTGSAPTASPTNSSGCQTGKYHAGEAITLTAHPGPGWGLDYWTGTNCSSCPFLTMPSSNRTVTAYYEQTSPTTLRIYNDLEDDMGWDQWNSLVWLKVAPYCGDIVHDGFGYPSGGTELLYPLDVVYDLGDADWIIPDETGSSYRDFDISGISTATDGSYCVLLQASYWQYIADPFYWWEKTPTNVTCCDGVSTCQKWFKIQIVKPYGDPEVIVVSDWLPDSWWVGHWSCP